MERGRLQDGLRPPSHSPLGTLEEPSCRFQTECRAAGWRPAVPLHRGPAREPLGAAPGLWALEQPDLLLPQGAEADRSFKPLPREAFVHVHWKAEILP